MENQRLFSLEERKAGHQAFLDDINNTRVYDVNIRVSMSIPIEKTSRVIASKIKEGDKVLDVGCNTGLVALMAAMAAPACQITGIEDNNNLVTVAGENFCLASMMQGAMKNASKGMPGCANVDFKYSNISKLPFPDNSMDVVYSFARMHRWDNPVKVFKEIKRVCKKNGIIYICDTARNASEGMVSFILQYTGRGAKEFMEELKASYTTFEAEEILKESGLGKLDIYLDGVNMVITNNKKNNGGFNG